MKKLFTILLIFSLVLTGCGQKETEKIEPVKTSEETKTIDHTDKSKPIGPLAEAREEKEIENAGAFEAEVINFEDYGTHEVISENSDVIQVDLEDLSFNVHNGRIHKFTIDKDVKIPEKHLEIFEEEFFAEDGNIYQGVLEFDMEMIKNPSFHPDYITAILVDADGAEYIANPILITMEVEDEILKSSGRFVFQLDKPKVEIKSLKITFDDNTAQVDYQL